MQNIHQNPVVVKVQNGTQRSDVNLCASCRFCSRRESSISGQISVICDANYQNPIVLSEPIGRCNRYLDANRLSLGEMVEIAWVVESRGKHIGFLSPEEVARRRQDAPPSHGF